MAKFKKIPLVRKTEFCKSVGGSIYFLNSCIKPNIMETLRIAKAQVYSISEVDFLHSEMICSNPLKSPTDVYPNLRTEPTLIKSSH